MKAEAANDRKIITDKLVFEKTGRTIEEWFEHLDKMGAKDLDHTAIFNLIAGTDGLEPLGQWNHNLLATSYEWDRGLKERGARPDGFEISVSRIIDLPIEILYAAWVDDKLREKWLPGEKIAFRKTSLNKSARITWSDNVTSLSVDLYSKGVVKTQVVVQHMKLPDPVAAAQMKEFWAAALGRLKSILE